MVHSESWQRLIDMAGEGQQPAGGNAEMSLASAEAPDGGGKSGGELKHAAGPWTTAASAAQDLKESTDRAKTKLQTSHEGITSEGMGLTAIAALGGVRSSWEGRLEDASRECGSLDKKLHAVAKAHGENEVKVGAKFSNGER